ncbi:MAG: DUF72 domain-containing protein [Planctomycetota bacterium]
MSGWSYPDWKGIVYPSGCKDTLRAVASLVDFLEINVSFYRTPAPAVTQSWLDRTAEFGTLFTAKLPSQFTHERVFRTADIDASLAAFAPLGESGRLAALLAQFPHSFKPDAAGFGALREIARRFLAVAPVLVEVRHARWRADDAIAGMRELGLAPIHLDYPGMQSDFAGPAVPQQQPMQYLRLHGRNAKAWFDPKAGRDATYDWHYSSNELQQIRDRILQLLDSTAAPRVFVAANNHFRGQALAAALELRAAFEAPAVRIPDSLCDRYPELQRLSSHRERGLFDRQ